MNQRLINCDFINNMETSNKARLVYFMFITNADNLGFVGNGDKLASSLDQCEQNYDNTLFQLKYEDAIKELLDKGFLYQFTNKHGGNTYLIRHWFIHNKYKYGLTTLFFSFYKLVELVDGEYHMREEDKVKESKVNQNKVNNEEEEIKEQENDEMPWGEIMEKLDALPKEKETTDNSFYDVFEKEKQ